MKGMILAAGFGTRMGELTKNFPKALLLHGGKTLIEHQIERLKNIGVDEIIVNVHYQKEKMHDYLNSKNFGVKITQIYEEEILGTGGGIINAGKILKESEVNIIVNTDVDTNFDIHKILNRHIERDNLITMLVQKRPASRYLRFGDYMELISRSSTKGKHSGDFAFNGIHILSGEFFDIYKIKGFADIIDIYLEILKKGFIVYGFDADNTFFKDIGIPDNLRK